MLSLIWRRAIAFVAAFYLAEVYGREFRVLLIGVHLPPNHWELLATFFVFGTLLWMAAPYSAIRYGVHDKFSQIALAFCGLVTILVFYWGVPVVTVICIALAFSILIASVRSAQRRNALAALAVALVFGFGGRLLSMYLETMSLKFFYLPLMRYSPRRLAVGVLFELLIAWIMTTACARVHDRLLRRDQRDTEIESSS